MKKHFEYPVAGLLIALGAVHFVLYVQFMATSSLWIDEMTSIIDYSSRGMWVSWLDYSSNNHSFFNILQAGLNWQDPFDPFAARLISIVACCLIFPVVIIICWPRGWVVESGVVLLIFATNSALLDWVLQGRGYGIQLLCGAVVFLGLLIYYEGRQRPGLALLSAAVVIGTWVIPSFVLFGGPVLLGLWLVERSTACFRAGAFALALIMGYYLPSFGLIVAEAGSYGEVHGRYFNSFTAVLNSIHQWILPLPTTGIVILILAFIAIPFLPSLPKNLCSPSRILVPGVCLFFAICLLLGTPPTRVTLFLTVPILLLLTVVGFRLLGETADYRRVAAGLLVLLAAVAVWPGWQTITRAPTSPFENWMETGVVLNTAFPDNLDVAVSYRGHLLDPYLADGVRRVDFDERDSAFAVVDSKFHMELDERLVGFSPRDYFVMIPQRRGYFIGILADYPKMSGISSIHAAPGPTNVALLTDGLPTTAWQLPPQQAAVLHIIPHSPKPLKALNWTQSDSTPVDALMVVDGTELPAERIRRYGNFVTADLRGMPAATIQLALRPRNSSAVITQLWIVEEGPVRP